MSSAQQNKSAAPEVPSKPTSPTRVKIKDKGASKTENDATIKKQPMEKGTSQKQQVANKEVHKKEQESLKESTPQKETTPAATSKMQEPAKDKVAEATKVANKKEQKPLQQWVKKEDCSEKGMEPGPSKKELQEQSKPPTQATKVDEDTYVPPARIDMTIWHQNGVPIQRLALIDMSADKNLLNHKTWNMLGKPKLESTTKFVQKSANVFGDCLGIIEIELMIGNHSEKAKFFVMAPGDLHEEVVLSRIWVAKRNCMIGWIQRRMTFLSKDLEMITVMLAQGIKETSPDVLEHRKSLQKTSTNAASINMDKGKAKMEPDLPTVRHVPTTLYKEEQTTPSSISKKEKQQRGQQKKVYQPKYPSLRTQKRRNKQVLVPKQMVQNQKLSDGDTLRWVEHQASASQISKGWLTTYKSLEAQGYLQGNRSLWLPKPQSTAYGVSSNPQRRQQSTPRSRKKGGRPWQARQRTNRKAADGHNKSTNKTTKAWIPKELLTQISSEEGNKMLVRIQAKSQSSKEYREWVAPHKLITAQGYYKGQSHIWLPKAPEKSPTTQAHLQKEGPSQVIKNRQPIRMPSSTEPATGLTRERKGKWVLKTQPTEQAFSARDITESQPQKENQLKRPPGKTTRQDKEKRVPKVAEQTTYDYINELPSTSQQGSQVPATNLVKEQSPNKPSTLDVAQHLGFLLKAFSSKKVKDILGSAF